MLVFWQVGTTGDLQCWEFFVLLFIFLQAVCAVSIFILKTGFPSFLIFPSTFFCYFNVLTQGLTV